MPSYTPFPPNLAFYFKPFKQKYWDSGTASMWHHASLFKPTQAGTGQNRKVIVKETLLQADNCGLVVFLLSIQCLTAGTLFFSIFLNELCNKKVQSCSCRRYCWCAKWASWWFYTIFLRVRFKTEGRNNPLRLSAVGLSFWWLWKLHIFFGHH